MAKVLILNTEKAARHLMAQTPDGRVRIYTIPGSNGIIPGSAPVDQDALDFLLHQKKDRVVQAWFESGILRPSNAPVEDREDTSVVVSPQAPAAPAAPAVPAVPAVPEDTEVPEVSADTPSDAPWATGNVK